MLVWWLLACRGPGLAPVAPPSAPQTVSAPVPRFPVVLRAEPGGTCALAREGAPAPVDLVPAGVWALTCAAEGYRTEVSVLEVTGPTERVVWLDPPGGHLDLLQVFPTGRQPKAVRIIGDELWVTALDGPPSVIVHDRATGAVVAEITLGSHGAVELATNRDHTRVWASQMETARVFEIDRASRTVLRELRTRSNWSKVLALSPDESTLYVSNWNFADVSAIDLATGGARRIPTVDTPRGLWPTPDGRFLYVAGYGAGELARIDLRTGASRTLWSSGGALRALASDGRTLYVSDMHSARIWARDLDTGAMRALGRTDPNPNSIALSPDGRLLFVSNRGPNGEGGYLTESGHPGSIVVLDTATGARRAAVAAGSQTTGLDLSPDGLILVATDFRDDRIRVWAVPPSAAW